MWQSEDWNGLDAATRVFLFSGVVLIVNQLPAPRAEAPAD
jgi:predicted small integral membrane protein